MKGIGNMVAGISKRLVESYKTLVIEKSRRLNIVPKVLFMAFALFCYLLVALVVVLIVFIVLFIALPLSLLYRRKG